MDRVNLMARLYQARGRSERSFSRCGFTLTSERYGVPFRDRRATYLVVAKRVPGRALPVLPAREVDAFVAHGHSVVLRDDYAPVDQLLAPVFAQKLHIRD
jgi:hypothetical protein